MTRAQRLPVIIGIFVLASAIGAAPTPAADFDADGIADLVIGVPQENVDGIDQAGSTGVLFGSLTGLTATDNQLWDQDDLVAEDGAEQADRFGWAVAAGDFNGDGAIDLAAGVPYEDIGSAINGGAVHVVYGVQGQGLAAPGNQLWHQGSPGIDGAVESYDIFGISVCVGDFNGDGYDDLAVGVIGESIGDVMFAGAVNVLYGGPIGLSAAGNQLFYEGHGGLSGIPEESDQLGLAIASGDFDADGYDDLGFSIPAQDDGPTNDAGEVRTIYGSPLGLVGSTEQRWVQGVDGLQNSAEDGDHFGTALAVGDFDGDGHDDLAIGTSREDFISVSNSGVVQIVYGSPAGLTVFDNHIWWNPDGAVDADRYGSALTTGDFNRDGYAELAVGIPNDTVGSASDAGTVEILYGSPAGLDRRSGFDDLWHQDRSGIAGAAEPGDRFGTTLAAGDFDGDGFADLAVGTPYEDINAETDAGAVNVLYGFEDGIAATRNHILYQGYSGLQGTPEADDLFGLSLAAIPPSPLLFRDSFEGGDTGRWSDTSQ